MRQMVVVILNQHKTSETTAIWGAVKYTVSFKDPNNLYNFEVSKANLEDIIKTINNYVFGVKNSDMLLNSISSIIASFLSRQVEQSA